MPNEFNIKNGFITSGNSFVFANLQVSGTTIVTPPTDTSAIVSTGYSVTTSGTTPMLRFSGSVNTSGNVIPYIFDVANIASGSGSFLAQFRRGGTYLWGIGLNDGIIYSTNHVPITGSWQIYARENAINGVVIRSTNPSTHTSGSRNHLIMLESFTPTGGTGTYTSILSNPTINQTGGSSGITRGLYINPIITAAADWRAIETTVGNVMLNTSSGNTLIGKTTDSGQKLQVSGNTLIQGSLTANTISATTLIVSGTYGGISTITNKPNLFDANGTARVDWSTGVLNSIANDTTVDWENKILYDSGAVASIDWENKILSSPNYVALEYSSDETINSQLYPRYVIPETVQRSVTNNITPSGQIIEATIQSGTTDYSLIYLDTDGTWKPLKNLPIVSTKMLGICISQSNSQVLIEGDIGVSDDNSQGAYITGADHGLPVYVSGTNGIMTVTAPTSGVVRVVGHIYYQSPTDANWWLMKFRPSNSWYEI